MQVLEGAQRRLRVKLTNAAGEQLPPELFLVYAGAFCPGYAPARFHAERTAEEWLLTMPGLKPGRVPWNWQVIAAECATGVEWLLAAGEVTVLPRVPAGAGGVAPEDLLLEARVDRVEQQLVVTLGESSALCSLAAAAAAADRAAAVLAQGDAEAARDGALAARSGAEDARDGALAALAGAEGAQAVAEDAAGVAQGFAQRAAGAADEALLAAAEAKAAEAGSAAAADVVRYDFLPMTLEWLGSRFNKTLGEGKFSMTYTEEENTLRVAFALETTEAQIEESRALLDRVLPRNLVTEKEWADGLPIDYKHVEYLETVTQNYGQYIATGLTPSSETSCKIRIMLLTPRVMNNTSAYAVRPSGGPSFNLMSWNDSGYFPMLYWGTQNSEWYEVDPAQEANKWVVFENRKNELWLNGVLRKALKPETFVCKNPMYLFVNNHIGSYPIGRSLQRCSGFEAWEGDVKIANYIPAFNKNTGTPGFFDTVNKVFKTNAGTGDFIYPGKETEETTYSLRNRKYAQYTEHGIRRLYRVPAGYEGSKEEYAAEHGFKILVETPMPEEGYWIPEWHEYEDYIELEWVETEAPTEEETFNQPE